MSTPDSRGRTHAPAVLAQAQRLGVDVGTIDGTGAGGRVSMADVLAAAPRPPAPPADTRDERVRAQQERDYLALFGEPMPADLQPARPVHAHRARPVTARSVFNRNVEVTVDAGGLNPLLEDAAQTHPCYPVAMTEAEPPTVFNSGDLPPFLASGLDPKVLLDLPWQARHAAAASESRAEVLAMIEACAADPADAGNYEHPGRIDFESRMSAWLVGPGQSADDQPEPA